MYYSYVTLVNASLKIFAVNNLLTYFRSKNWIYL